MDVSRMSGKSEYTIKGRAKAVFGCFLKNQRYAKNIFPKIMRERRGYYGLAGPQPINLHSF